MNRYGRLAQQHWAKWRPDQLSQIPDPETFFTELGEEAETQIQALEISLAGDDPGGEDYLQKVGRLRTARMTAESQVLREMVLLEPEPGHPEAEDPQETDLPPGVIGQTDWMPMVLRPGDPGYHDLDDSPFLHRVTPEELAARQQTPPQDR
ncbi:MAG: hypothetical protein J0H43_02860 [Actinobacteria bacterium]|nr:hypothetical protein [Actinomycetota bacterium]